MHLLRPLRRTKTGGHRTWPASIRVKQVPMELAACCPHPGRRAASLLAAPTSGMVQREIERLDRDGGATPDATPAIGSPTLLGSLRMARASGPAATSDKRRDEGRTALACSRCGTQASPPA